MQKNWSLTMEMETAPLIPNPPIAARQAQQIPVPPSSSITSTAAIASVPAVVPVTVAAPFSTSFLIISGILCILVVAAAVGVPLWQKGIIFSSSSTSSDPLPSLSSTPSSSSSIPLNSGATNVGQGSQLGDGVSLTQNTPSSSSSSVPTYISSSLQTSTPSPTPLISSSSSSVPFVVATDNVSFNQVMGTFTWPVNFIGDFQVTQCVKITWQGDANDYYIGMITATNPSTPSITVQFISVSPTNTGLNTPWLFWNVQHTSCPSFPPSSSSSSLPLPIPPVSSSSSSLPPVSPVSSSSSSLPVSPISSSSSSLPVYPVSSSSSSIPICQLYSTSCLNQATCSNIPNAYGDQFTCLCYGGYTGRYCQYAPGYTMSNFWSTCASSNYSGFANTVLNYVIPPTMMLGTGVIVGKNIYSSSLNVVIQQCQAFCCQTIGCVGFSVDVAIGYRVLNVSNIYCPSDGGVGRCCVAHNSIHASTPSTDVYSGIVDRYKANTSVTTYTGGVTGGVLLNSVSIFSNSSNLASSQCLSLCISTPGCTVAVVSTFWICSSNTAYCCSIYPAVFGFFLSPVYNTILTQFSSPQNTPLTYNYTNSLQNLAPVRGWDTWDVIISPSETLVIDNARYISQNLLQYGYNLVEIEVWESTTTDAYGRIFPDPSMFPSSSNGAGFLPLSNYIHSLNLTFGLHLSNSIYIVGTFNGSIPIYNSPYTFKDMNLTFSLAVNDGTINIYEPWAITNSFNPAIVAYINANVLLWASWGVDFIKLDFMPSSLTTGPPPDDIVNLYNNAINQTGRQMLLSMVVAIQGEPQQSEVDLSIQNGVAQYRITADVGALGYFVQTCPTIYTFPASSGIPSLYGYSYPDLDMLPFGNNRFTTLNLNQTQSMMSVISMVRAPLIYGGNFETPDPVSLSVITNTDVLLIQAYSGNLSILAANYVVEILTTNRIDSQLYWLSVSNWQSSNIYTSSFSLYLTGVDTNATSSTGCCVKDIWNHYQLGCGLNSITARNIYPDSTGLYEIFNCTSNPVSIVQQQPLTNVNLLLNLTANSTALRDNSIYQNTFISGNFGGQGAVIPSLDPQRGWIMNNPSYWSYININNVYFLPGVSFTTSLWYKTTAFLGGSIYFIGNVNSDGGGSGDYWLKLYGDFFQLLSDGQALSSLSLITFPLNVWNLISWTFDANTGLNSIYINSTAIFWYVSYVPTTSTRSVQLLNHEYNAGIVGLIDQFQFYNISLSPNQINQLYINTNK